jgi:DNA-binding response OmpR family regulator
MNILIAEDDDVIRTMLGDLVRQWGFNMASADSGDAAWEQLQSVTEPTIVLMDWQLPGMLGDEICRRVRAELKGRFLYLILLTAERVSAQDLVSGFASGADDFLTKPFDPRELRARLQVGERTLGLQATLQRRIAELEAALAQVKQLKKLLPICCYCKKIRDDADYWHEVEQYMSSHADLEFTHGICPGCFEKHIKPHLRSGSVTSDR